MRRARLLVAALLMALLAPAAVGEPVGEPVPAPGDSLATPAGGVELIYFHATLRCETCLALEASIERCLRAEFAAELAQGRLAWRSLDYELGEGRALHANLELSGSELVIRRRAAGESRDAQPIRSVWNAPEAVALCDSLQPIVTQYLRAQPDAEATSGR